MEQNKVLHISMNALKRSLLFRTDSDYKFGVNSLAIVLSQHKVRLLCYCLMSNHLHLLLLGTEASCIGYYDSLMMRLGRLYAESYNRSWNLQTNAREIVEVKNLYQFRNVVAYILRNPYKAGISSPYGYRWSSIDAYFHISGTEIDGTPVNSLKTDDRRKILRTRCRLPDEYMISDGCITNKSFVSAVPVMEKFSGEIDFYNALKRTSVEAEIEMDAGISTSITYSDQEMRLRIQTILEDRFHKKDLARLSSDQLISMASILKRKYYIGKAQIGRLLGLSDTILERLFR